MKVFEQCDNATVTAARTLTRRALDFSWEFLCGNNATHVLAFLNADGVGCVKKGAEKHSRTCLREAERNHPNFTLNSYFGTFYFSGDNQEFCK